MGWLHIFSMIVLLVLLLILPLIIQKTLEKVKWMNIVGYVVWCYLVGILISFTPIYKMNAKLIEVMMHIAIPIAIPLFVFARGAAEECIYTKEGVKSFFLLIISVVLVSVSCGYFFHRWDDNSTYHAAMLAGTYIGGTINMAAVTQIFQLPHEHFLMVNTSDNIFGGTYLLFFLSIAPAVFGLFLKHTPVEEQKKSSLKKIQYRGRDVANLLFASLLTAGLSYLTTLIFPKSWEQVAFFLFLTLYAYIIAKKIKANLAQQSTGVGNYLLIIFCLCIGMQLNPARLGAVPVSIHFMVGCILISSILLHLLLAKLFSIQRDVYIVSNTAGILGPPFIPSITDSLKRNDLLVMGVSLGIFGNIIGNYMGVSVQAISAYLLSL